MDDIMDVWIWFSYNLWVKLDMSLTHGFNHESECMFNGDLTLYSGQSDQSHSERCGLYLSWTDLHHPKAWTYRTEQVLQFRRQRGRILFWKYISGNFPDKFKRRNFGNIHWMANKIVLYLTYRQLQYEYKFMGWVNRWSHTHQVYTLYVP